MSVDKRMQKAKALADIMYYKEDKNLMHKRKLKRILAMMVATTTILGMSITTFAAPADFNAVEYAIVNPDVRAVYGTDADALYNHYQSFGQSENRIMTIADAVSKGKSVDVKQMIAQFIAENKSLYVDNVLNGEFAYFNLETYKAEITANLDEKKADVMILKYFYNQNNNYVSP